MKPKTTAFIPLRGNSKSIPLKNIKTMAGKPLAFWAIKAAIDCDAIDRIVISTDSNQIREALGFIESPKVVFFERSPETATDSASTESAMWDYFSKNVCEHIVLIQATSPLLTAQDLSQGLRILKNGSVDSVISLVRLKRFFWQEEAGLTVPKNYSLLSRPRRQEFAGELVENGAFYITPYSLFLKTRCRLNGKIGFHEMDADSFVEVDEPSDWSIVEDLLIKKKRGGYFSSLKDLKVFAMDIDGCLTDAGMYYSETGDELKKFNTRDGMGLKLLKKAGIKVGVITGEDRDLNRRRSKKLDLDFEFHNIEDKIRALDEVCKKFKVSPNQVAYVGDDLNDLEILKAVGFSACPLDACRQIKSAVDYIASVEGGRGVIREFTELYFKTLGRFESF